MSKKKVNEASCEDCGRLYGNKYGFPDLVIPNWAWEKISPYGDQGGLLCPCCIIIRLDKANINNIPSVFTSGPLAFEARHWIRPPWQKPLFEPEKTAEGLVL